MDEIKIGIDDIDCLFFLLYKGKVLRTCLTLSDAELWREVFKSSFEVV